MITVITSTLNSKAALRETARSVLSQQVPLQWIIADGDSKDGSREFLKTLQDERVFWFSEPDVGIYDAWNKACQHITGDWVIFIGAGDLFMSDSTLEQVSQHIDVLPDFVDFLYGDVAQIYEGKVYFRYGEVDLSSWQSGRRALPAHQGIFHKASLLKQSKPFDDSYRLAGDTKFLTLRVTPSNTIYVPMEVTYMDPFGISSNRGNALLMMRELQRIWREVGCVPPWTNRLNFSLRCYMKFALHHLGLPSTWSIERTMRTLCVKK